jgi:phosphosulfolactate phosphohydrolase-like enzyme
MKEKIIAGVNLELLDNKGIILESPNGTRYILKVNDSGTITTAIA